MYTSSQILQQVNYYIDHLTYNRKPESLYEPIKYVLSLGGKRIRPVLMLLAYNLYKDDHESILPSACALETYHNYTLLHDDLMDNADLRRGHQTVHKRWDANTAILSGDSMLVLAYERMAQCRPDKLKPVLDLFTETALEIGEGLPGKPHRRHLRLDPLRRDARPSIDAREGGAALGVALRVASRDDDLTVVARPLQG